MMKKALAIATSALLCLSAMAWSPAGDHIKTRWASEIDPSCPLPEYPRPQMVRSEWQNLNGLWNYAITPVGTEYSKPEGQILIPFCPESSLSGLARRVGEKNVIWYERTFTVPKTWKGRNVLLHFGAVDWKADVWVNGQKVGDHTGGYVPFSFDITSYLKKSGKQTLRVRAWDSTDNGFQPRGKQVNDPRGIWYTPVTGIWQTVWMEPVSSAGISRYAPSYNHEAGTLTIMVDLSGTAKGDKLVAELVEGCVGYSAEQPGSGVIMTESAPVMDPRGPKGPMAMVRFAIPEPEFWSPDHPYLYGLKLRLERDGQVLDSVDGYTAIRTISVRPDKVPSRNVNSYRRLALNGSPLFQYGPLDQGWWPDGLYTAPTDEALRYDIERTKAWGFNMIRKHIKVEPARWYHWCDRLGIMVWQDMPSIGDNDGKRERDIAVRKANANEWSRDSYLSGTDARIPEPWRINYYKEWREIITSLKGFQSIVMWVPFNEAWGQFETKEVVAFTRDLDPTRLINESSGGNFHFCGDVLDVHHYPCPAMNAFEAKFCNVLGEYGGIGLPVEGHLWQSEGSWGYVKLKEKADEVLQQYADFAEMLKVFIGTGCSAAVYTQTTDVESEINGLMTYDRLVKVDEEKLREINTSVIGTLK